MTTSATTLGERVAATVRAHMGWRRLPVSELARVLGLGQRAAKRRYDGVRDFSLTELERVAEWLDIDREDLAAGRMPERAA
ncbi:hypothetical protein [Agrococcus sp. Marseille-Q4369]|uniref:hypothetical protein n=1 Tax=Agrococcus sp. Marseille-Q4369 TaxID=2810513 RepID=UPI001B8C745F|nr:hypothetical protein [Agrococcus sp. Marseille-Q4369]QUW18857.1 hypothetical protein JSQ78_00275 [Agrococcus sp. Marseille-Q4369]